MPKGRQRTLLKRAVDIGIYAPAYQDPAYIVWHLGQYEKQRIVQWVNTGSDHSLWIAYDRGNEAAKQEALRAHGFRTVKGDRVDGHESV